MSPATVWLLAAVGLVTLSGGGAPGMAASSTRQPDSRALARGAWEPVNRGPASSSPGDPCPGCLRAGAHSVDVTPPVGVPLAGYGEFGRRRLVPDLLGLHPYAFWFKPSRGVHQPLKARALVLERGQVRVLWIAVDLIGVSPVLVSDLKSRLVAEGLSYSAVIVAASHTHSGPGGFARSGLFGFLALDRFVPEVADHLLRGMVEAARQAELKKIPARVGGGSGVATGIAVSRLNLPLDPEVGVLKVVAADGAPLALLWNYAVHGTALGWNNLLFSGDLMGVAAQRLERSLGVPVLYTNGAVADVSPARHGLEGAEALGEALAREVRAVWDRVKPGGRSTLSTLKEPFELPKPRLTLRNCVGHWVPRSVTVGLGWAMTQTSELVAVAVGDHAWLTIPGELESRLGQEVKAAGRGFFQGTFVVGLANDYLGYLLTQEAYRRPSYIGCVSLFGERAGERVTARAKALIRRLGESGR